MSRADLKSSKVEKQAQRLATVSIDVSDVENVMCFADGAAKVVIFATHRGTNIATKSNNNSDGFDPSEGNIELKYELKVDVSDQEEIFELFANPVLGKNEHNRKYVLKFSIFQSSWSNCKNQEKILLS